MFLAAASLPPALGADGRRPGDASGEDYGRPGHYRRPPKPPFSFWHQNPGGPGLGFSYNYPPRRPYRPRPARPWYGPQTPYYGNSIYMHREEEKSGAEYFADESGAPPDERSYFQGAGEFERLPEPPPPPPDDGRQADLDNYRLMMRAWQR